jgi:hypothetical protein
MALRGAMQVGERFQLMDQALGMDPAQGVAANVELSGVIAEDNGVGQEAVRAHAAPQRPLGGQPHRVLDRCQCCTFARGDAEPVQMRLPRRVIGEPCVGVPGQAGDQRTGQGTVAHIGQRRGVDDIVGVAGAQQIEKVQPALARGGGEPGKVLVADLRADAVGGFVARAGIVHADPGGVGQAGAQHVTGFVAKPILARDQQAHHLTARDIHATARNCAAMRRTVTCPW